VFVPSLRVIRRHVITHPAVSPDQIAAAIRCAVEVLLSGLLPDAGCGPSPLTPTAVKRRMSNDQLKRAQHRISPS
jgi:hypothetical protein